MIKLYCGGPFHFFYLNENYKDNAKRDYRARLLDDEERMLVRHDPVMINENIRYVGPFYFESDGMIDEEIVAVEREMLNSCTHAVFLLEEASCPGTIAELVYAASLRKDIAVFYVQSKDGEETESKLHTPCWFPIIMSRQMCAQVKLFPCLDYDDASRKIKDHVYTLR